MAHFDNSYGCQRRSELARRVACSTEADSLQSSHAIFQSPGYGRVLSGHTSQQIDGGLCCLIDASARALEQMSVSGFFEVLLCYVRAWGGNKWLIQLPCSLFGLHL